MGCRCEPIAQGVCYIAPTTNYRRNFLSGGSFFFAVNLVGIASLHSSYGLNPP